MKGRRSTDSTSAGRPSTVGLSSCRLNMKGRRSTFQVGCTIRKVDSLPTTCRSIVDLSKGKQYTVDLSKSILSTVKSTLSVDSSYTTARSVRQPCTHTAYKQRRSAPTYKLFCRSRSLLFTALLFPSLLRDGPQEDCLPFEEVRNIWLQRRQLPGLYFQHQNGKTRCVIVALLLVMMGQALTII